MQFFNSKVRDAYSLIAAGVIALGLGQLVQPLLSLAGLDSSPYLPIIIIAITLPAIVPLYLGGRRLALILEIKNWATSLKVMVLLWALSTAIIMLIPRPDPGVPVWLYNFSVVMQSWMVAMSAASAFILYKITGISAKYSKVNKSLLHALAALTAFTVFMFIANNISVKFGTLQIIGVSIGATAVGILLLRAGYVFYTRERA